MKKGIHPLVIGNWKMNPTSGTLAVKLAKQLKSSLARVDGVEVVVAPPCIYTESVKKVCNGSRAFALGAQNTHFEKFGSYTGEISLTMLKNEGVSYVIVGHSERRAGGETDAQVHIKLVSAVKAGFTVVLCVGEKVRDESAHYLTDIERQIRSALAEVPRTKLGMIVIAYEPVWAIGTGRTATPEDVHEMRLFIERVLSDIYGRNYAVKVRVLYGGSVNGKNAQELFTAGTVDGFLVGGASLHAEDFTQIVKAVRTI